MCHGRLRSEPISPAFETVVTTIFRKSPQQVDLRRLNSSSLESLKADDPFMYYSLPKLKKDAMVNEDISTYSDMSSNFSKAPKINMEYDASSTDDNSSIVPRLSRLSVECHPDLIYAYLVGAADDTDNEHDFDEEDEYFLLAVLESQGIDQ